MTNTINYTDGLKETCDICNGPAGHETSPEGQPCDICDAWICDQHVDYRHLRILHENADKHGHAFEGTYAICTECSAKARLPNDYSAPAPERDEILVPEWVILQSVRYALPRHTAAVKETADHLISIWRTLTAATRSIILRDITDEHAIRARQHRQHRSEIDERTWRDTLNQLARLEDSLTPHERATRVADSARMQTHSDPSAPKNPRPTGGGEEACTCHLPGSTYRASPSRSRKPLPSRLGQRLARIST